MPLGHVRYHGHDMGTQPYLTDEQVARMRGVAVPHGRWSVAGRRASHTQPARAKPKPTPSWRPTRQSKKWQKRVKLCPVFDTKCRGKDRPRRLRERLSYAHGLLRNDYGYLKAVLLALMVWGFIAIAPFLWTMVKFFVFMLTVWLILAIAGPRRTPYQEYRYRQYRRRRNSVVHFANQKNSNFSFRERVRVARRAVVENKALSNRSGVSTLLSTRYLYVRCYHAYEAMYLILNDLRTFAISSPILPLMPHHRTKVPVTDNVNSTSCLVLF